MSDLPYYEEETFSGGLSREDTIEKQVRTCFKRIEFNVDERTVDKYYNQFIKIQETLEMNTNMVFKKKFIKTYE